jgi:flagellar hook assembly protein FlgD
VRNLLEADLEPGPYAVTWDGKNTKGSSCASGLYLYRLEMENETPAAKKMILMN